MRSTGSISGRLVVVVCNVAGMVDLVALPLWVGSLMQSRGFSAQQAGMLVTVYILGVFASSLFFAPKLTRLNSRVAATVGMMVGAAAFLALTVVTAFLPMALLHLGAGLGAGCGLSFTHGTIGRSSAPHRLFALGGFGTGVFAIVFFAIMPTVLHANGASGLFFVLATLLGVAGFMAAVAFPRLDPPRAAMATAQTARFVTKVLAFCGVACLATTQAMIFSFIERIGAAHGFASTSVAIMLIVGGFVNLTAPICATVLEKRVSHLGLAIAVVPIHALFGALAVLSSAFLPYAIFAVVFVWLIIFGHNFMFSLIAQLDPSGRTVAATPAMLMIGSAVGPTLGGTLVESHGYSSLAVAAGVLAALGTSCFVAIWVERRRAAHETALRVGLMEPTA